MQFVEEEIIHKLWGTGTVTSEDNGYLTVHFESIDADKSFTYPDAFSQYLSFRNKKLQNQAIKELSERQEQEKRDAEARLTEHIPTKRPDLSKVSTPQKRPDIILKPFNYKKQPEKKGSDKNLAFKLNFCDGGASDTCIGFHGPCSDSNIKYNIETAKRSWCSCESCPCRQYYNRTINRQQLDVLLEDIRNCYETFTLRNWIGHAGVNNYGDTAGKPRHIANVQNGSLAILTTRLPGSSEIERVIVGVFIVDNIYEGNSKEESFISCNSKYHLEIRPNEVNKLKFWNYYRNPVHPEKIAWGMGLYRSIDDHNAIALLEDIVSVKEGTEAYSLAKEILERYKGLHR